MRQSRAPPKPPLPADAADCPRPDSATLPLVRAFLFSEQNQEKERFVMKNELVQNTLETLFSMFRNQQFPAEIGW